MEKENVVEKEVKRLFGILEGVDPTDKQYETIANNLEKVSAIQNPKVSWIGKLDPNTVIVAAVNLVGILVILKYEKFDVLTSKAIGFILRPKT